jgi:tetratricopeptide (TPR) repeat protein
MRLALPGLLAFALLAAPAAAATLKLEDGTRVECKVRSYDSATQTLHVTTADGAEASYTLAQLDARSVYQINSSLIPANDAQAQLLAANFARDAGLYAHAARRYATAAKLDPSMKAAIEGEMGKLKRAAAEFCMANAHTAVAKGDIPEAEKWLKTLIEKLPGEPEADEAGAMLERYYGKLREEKMAKAEAQASDALKSDAAPARKRYDQMVEKTKQGLQAKGDSKAASLYKDALSDGKYVLGQLDQIEKKHKSPEVTEKVSEYRRIVGDQMIDLHLHLASQLATQSDYKGAQREVSQALSIDPKNEAALSMRARIEDYASQGLGWWGWR